MDIRYVLNKHERNMAWQEYKTTSEVKQKIDPEDFFAYFSTDREQIMCLFKEDYDHGFDWFEERDWSKHYISCPGDTIADFMKEKGLSASELGNELGISSFQMYQLLNGEFIITQHFAIMMSIKVGSSTDFWVNREREYRRKAIERARRVLRSQWVDGIILKIKTKKQQL